MTVLVPLLGLAGMSLTACGLAARGTPSLGNLAWAQLFLLAFALGLAAMTAFWASLGFRPPAAQLFTTAVALAMIGNVFYANPAIEAARSEGARELLRDACLWTSPWMIVAGSLLQEDPLRATELYNWSVIKYYGPSYPGAGIASVAARALLVTGVYAAAALLLAVLGSAATKLRRRDEPGLKSPPESG